MLRIAPIALRAANAHIAAFHRHSKPVRGWLFGASAVTDGRLCGVVVVGRPVARALQDGATCEVTRLCTDGTRNACSLLYAAAARAAKALGYRRIVTYTRTDESGASLLASGWTRASTTYGRQWDTPTRRRSLSDEVCDRVRWELQL